MTFLPTHLATWSCNLPKVTSSTLPQVDEEMFRPGFADLPALEGLDFLHNDSIVYSLFTQFFRRCAKSVET